MNCAQFKEIVHDLARNVALDESTRQSALAHADFCLSCDQLLTDSQALTAALRSLGARDRASEVPQRIEDALRTAFRENRSAAVRSARAWRWAAAGLAAAAAIAIFAAVLLRHPSVTAPNPGSGSELSSTNLPSPARTDSSPLPNTLASATNSPSNASPEYASDYEPEYATSFVSLPFAYDSAPAEDETIVRMK